MYFETHINIKKIPKYWKKNLRICKKILHCFSLFEVLYNWVKFRRLKMGDPVYNSRESKILFQCTVDKKNFVPRAGFEKKTVFLF